MQGLRITKESALAYFNALNDEKNTALDFGKTPAEWAALKEAKRREL
ncbi:MAG TPA: hypothetical protein VEV41_10240 [Terriglobales bacterium]|nr:hypothetical protein [Terriglobales bacterium]